MTFPETCDKKRPGRPKGITPARQERMDALVEIVRENQPCTIRNVLYRSMVSGIATKKDYSKIQRDLVELRRSGRVPYAWITDNIRLRQHVNTYNGLDDALRATASFYRRDLWRDAARTVEVWCESDSIAGVLCPPCAAEHTGRHSWEVEHHCDVCGQLADTMRSVLATADVATLTRTTAGRTSIYLGPVLVVALGPCVPCADAAGLRAPEVVER